MEREQLSLRCDCTPVAETRYGRGEASPTDAVVTAIAAASDVDPTAFTPLHEFVDTDALERMFDRARDDGPAGRILGFTVDGWNVFVCDDGRVRVCDPSGPSDPSPIFD